MGASFLITNFRPLFFDLIFQTTLIAVAPFLGDHQHEFAALLGGDADFQCAAGGVGGPVFIPFALLDDGPACAGIGLDFENVGAAALQRAVQRNLAGCKADVAAVEFREIGRAHV